MALLSLVLPSRPFTVPKAREVFHAKIFLSTSSDYLCVTTFRLAAKTDGALYVVPAESGYLRGLSTKLQPFLKVVRLTDSSLRESDVLDMINEAGSLLQTLEIHSNAVDICRQNLDRLLHGLPVIRQLNIHICTANINAEFSGPCMLVDEAISTIRELALECPSGCPPPKHTNWVDGGKVVFISSIWDRLSKLEVRRHRLHFRKAPKIFWNFTSSKVCPCHNRELHIPQPMVFKSGLELEGIDSGIQDLFLEHKNDDPVSGSTT